MNRIGMGIFIACVFTVSSASGEAVDIEGIVARNLPAVVLIHGKRQDNGAPVQGSGCVIHPAGYILATAHQAQGVRPNSPTAPRLSSSWSKCGRKSSLPFLRRLAR